jgi:hypothetical protein
MTGVDEKRVQVSGAASTDYCDQNQLVACGVRGVVKNQKSGLLFVASRRRRRCKEGRKETQER